ncbi:MAG: ANTAR domain-containing protein [bacterium]|nr:ANTAR domain-containing protein [Candidatus Margulisiibacteriota bacterium]
MLNERQEEILQQLGKHPFLKTKDLQKMLGLSRARIHQLISPLIDEGLVESEGSARATIYRLTSKRSSQQIRRENWNLRNRIKDLEKALLDRKIIERAKEILIAQFDILPTEAYRKLQEQSMDSGRSMRQIAESILSAYEVGFDQQAVL